MAKVIIEPVKNDKGFWTFPGVEAVKLFRNGTTMLGVLSTRMLPAGSKFEYFGKKLTKSEFDDLVKSEKAKKLADQIPHRLAYVVQLKKDLYLDAYHKTPFGVAGRGKYLGGCVNEPKRSGQENCKLVVSHKNGSHAYIVAKQDIPQGHELSFNYGSSYKRNY
jgi:hypothetical protein